MYNALIPTLFLCLGRLDSLPLCIYRRLERRFCSPAGRAECTQWGGILHRPNPNFLYDTSHLKQNWLIVMHERDVKRRGHHITVMLILSSIAISIL